MSSLMNYLFKKLEIKIKTVAPYNHQSLLAEHGIKSLSTILMKHLTGLGKMWPKYLSLATFASDLTNHNQIYYIAIRNKWKHCVNDSKS